MRNYAYFVLLAFVLSGSTKIYGQAQFFDPTPYVKPADVPAGFATGPMYIENFEDRHVHADLSIQGLGLVLPSNVTDSVDDDDGALDGLGRAGTSFQASLRVRIEFATKPTFAGVVWTDGNNNLSFEAFDAAGLSLGVRGPFNLADGLNTGGTAEDRFFGVRNAGGISALEFRAATGGIEIDHVQWEVKAPLADGSALRFPNVQFERPGSVLDLLRLSNGQLYVLGEFELPTQIGIANLVRLNVDGSIDSGFNSGLTSSCFRPDKLLLDSQQRLYVQCFSNVFRLLADGSVDSSFSNVGFNGRIFTSAVISDGLLVGGAFTQAGGNPRSRLAKLRLDGSLDPNFSLDAGDAVESIVSFGTDQAFVGGRFTTIASIARSRIAKLNTSGNGSVVLDWNPGISFASGGSSTVFQLALTGSDLFVLGDFDRVAGLARNDIAKLSTNAGAALDSTWNVSANINAFDHELHIQNGFLYAAGALFANPPNANHVSSVTKIALAGTGAIDTSFVTIVQSGIATGTAHAIEQSDSPARIVLGGDFPGVNNNARFSLVPLTSTGQLDPVRVLLEPKQTAKIFDVARDSSQRYYWIGDYQRINGTVLAGVARTNAVGQVDLLWRPAISAPLSIEMNATEAFISDQNRIHRVNLTDGSAIAGWQSLGNSGKLVLTQDALYCANPPRRIAITGNGTADPNFNANFTTGSISDIAFDSSSNGLLVSGFFSAIGGGARSNLALLDAQTGQLRTSFDPDIRNSANNLLGGFVLAPDIQGGVWIASPGIATINGTAQTAARLKLSDGEIDSNVTISSANPLQTLGFHQGHVYLLQAAGNRVLRISQSGGAPDPSWGVRLRNASAPKSIAGLADSILLLGDEQALLNDAVTNNALVLPLQERLQRAGFE